jgi:hypothetical protein
VAFDSRWLGILVSSSLVFTACARKTGTEQAKPAPHAQARAAPDGEHLMQCRDFLTKAELAAIGVDASRYDEESSQSPHSAGLRCRFGRVSAAIFRGEHFSKVLQSQQDDLQSGVVEPQVGMPIGSETYWTSFGTLLSTDFLSTSKQFAANLSSPDRSAIMKVGQALDAKMYVR